MKRFTGIVAAIRSLIRSRDRDVIDAADVLESAARDVLHRTITFASCDYSLVPNDALDWLRDAAGEDEPGPDAMRWTPQKED